MAFLGLQVVFVLGVLTGLFLDLKIGCSESWSFSSQDVVFGQVEELISDVRI